MAKTMNIPIEKIIETVINQIEVEEFWIQDMMNGPVEDQERNKEWRKKRQKIIQKRGQRALNGVQAPGRLTRYAPCKQKTEAKRMEKKKPPPPPPKPFVMTYFYLAFFFS